MIEVPYYNKEGEAEEPLKFDETAFGTKVRKRLLRDAVLMYEAARRQGCIMITGLARSIPAVQVGIGDGCAGLCLEVFLPRDKG